MAKDDPKADPAVVEKKPTGDDPVAVKSTKAGDPESNVKGDDPKTYTQSDVDRIADAVIARKDKEASDALATHKEEAERAKLAGEGKYQELAEKLQGETVALKAERERAKFVSESRDLLKEQGLSSFQDVLLKGASTLEEMGARAGELKTVFDTAVDAEVAKRLNTETVPKTPKPGPEDPDWGSHISTEDWIKKKAEQKIY